MSCTFVAGASPVSRRVGFTLVEVLLSITILSVVLVTTTMLLDASLGQLRIAEARLAQFREAQAAFETMSLRLAGCDISPYYGYEYQNQDQNTVPIGHKLQSDLHFVSGPARSGPQPLFASGQHPGHAIFFHGTYGFTEDDNWSGFGTLLNSWGFFVEFGDDSTTRAAFLNGTGGAPRRYRFRLRELQVPAEQVRTYAAKLNSESTQEKIFAWFRDSKAASGQVHTVAENILALIITPLVPPGSKDANGSDIGVNGLAPAYYYDTRNYQHARTSQAESTRHRLPPLLNLTLIALDEASAQRLEDLHGAAMPNLGMDLLFQDATRYHQDIQTLETSLQGLKLNYRVFSTTVRLRNARWTGTY
ncbi:MAG TPA: Verru_Chthon cassette protein C [Candidatus Saccharimonadia bacterium]|nr:Verru_Chthon cassette protein C [Candidatus Saccharimonadia bacterium]